MDQWEKLHTFVAGMIGAYGTVPIVLALVKLLGIEVKAKDERPYIFLAIIGLFVVIWSCLLTFPPAHWSK